MRRPSINSTRSYALTEEFCPVCMDMVAVGYKRFNSEKSLCEHLDSSPTIAIYIGDGEIFGVPAIFLVGLVPGHRDTLQGGAEEDTGRRRHFLTFFARCNLPIDRSIHQSAVDKYAAASLH
ncbi:hypothetical protein PGTUg99_002587 [Puccinia graminis f. sp. tritici]|uniref:Uncharacterized protein n=1 Tax=Puccinia graminis f. sp. tritici TaxID=56615 RepID=A0A5B0RG73_PUCGR|nr:hypothetical protein PGTUg99_002587 [Puccinia graminis f. sp. tritici]